MESAFFCDFFGNFFHARWKILFSCRGEHARCVWNEHRKTQNSKKLKFLFWVEGSIGGCGGHTRWVTWGGLYEVDHARWVTWGGSHKVGYARWITWGGLCEVGHARWVMQGGLCEVVYARWIMWGTSHLMKCFTPWYFNYPWIVWIHFEKSMHNVILHFSYPWIVNCSMDNANELFTYPWIVNSIIHLQLNELV